MLFRRELAPEGGLRGRFGDGGELRVEFRGLGGIAGGSDAGRNHGAGGGDNAGNLGLDAGVEIGLCRLQFRDAGLQGGGIGVRRIALGLERVDFGGKQCDFAAQRIKVGGRFGQQVALGGVIPAEVFNLGAGIGELIFGCGVHRS